MRSLKINTALTEGARLQVAVRDSGGGIAPADQERLFDAFWTTKKGGFGLGLTISRTIVESSGGTIALGSTTPHGTTILFEVPTTQETEI